MSKKVLSPYCPPQTLDYLTFSAEGNLLTTSFDTDDGTEVAAMALKSLCEELSSIHMSIDDKLREARIKKKSNPT